MKKVISAVLAGTMALSMAACGGSSASSAAPAAPASSAAPAASTTEPASTDIDWPKENITMVVPYSAGGDTDTYARQLSQGLSKELGANVVVVNTTGGSGVVASSSVLTAEPNGYTLLFHHTGVMLTQEAVKSNEFSFFDDFEVVSTVARDDTYALIVPSSAPYQTTEEFIAYCKANPGAMKYSVTFNGATHAVATAMQQTMGIEMNCIDVGSSTADRLTAFMAGQCDCLVVNFMNIADYVENGDFTVLGICAEERLAGLEDFPTLKEQGYNVIQPKMYEVRAPKGTDQAICDKLSAAIEKVTATAEFSDTLATYYAQPFYRNSADTLAQDKATVEELQAFFAA